MMRDEVLKFTLNSFYGINSAIQLIDGYDTYGSILVGEYYDKLMRSMMNRDEKMKRDKIMHTV